MKIAWKRWQQLWQSINLILVIFCAMPLMMAGIFYLTDDSLSVCLLLVVPIVLMAWVVGWHAGAGTGVLAAMLTSPYVCQHIPLLSSPLSGQIWEYLGVCYVILGLLVGIEGARSRYRDRRLLAAEETASEDLQVASKHYETLLEEMNERQALLDRMNSELALLNTIATAVNSSLNLQQVQQAAMAHLNTILAVDQIQFYGVDAQDAFFVLQASRPEIDPSDQASSIPQSTGLFMRLMQSPRVEMITLTAANAPLRPPSIAAQTRSIMAVPLRSRGRVLGALVLGRSNESAFTEDDAKFLESVGRILGVATENAMLFQRAKEQSLSDDLTELGNRRLLQYRLSTEISRALASGTPLCLVMMDLDHFKKVNDQYGHPAGDEVLRMYGERVRREIRTADILCRYGGEEFALATINTPLEAAFAVSERICRHIAQTPFTLESGEVISLTMSAGVACLQPGISTLDELVTAADSALYDAKSAGRNRVNIYQQSAVRVPTAS